MRSSNMGIKVGREESRLLGGQAWARACDTRIWAFAKVVHQVSSHVLAPKATKVGPRRREVVVVCWGWEGERPDPHPPTVVAAWDGGHEVHRVA